jgi:predicted Zn finger-like uncharacterized protein
MYTQCPQCNTIFPLSNLKINAKGKCLCKQCKTAFEANACLVSTYQVAETETDRLKVGDQTLDARSETELLHALEEEEKLKIEKQRQSRFWWFIFALLLLGLLVTQYYWVKQPHFILQHEKIRPVLNHFCEYVGCQLPATQRVKAFRVVNKHLNQHNHDVNAVSLRFMFKNTAQFPQPYPGIEIRFEDANGQTMGMRQLLPTEYMSSWQIGQQISAGGQISVRLDFVNIVDNLHTFGYQISFF